MASKTLDDKMDRLQRKDYPYFTENQILESAENLDHAFELSLTDPDRVWLDAWAACLEGTSMKYYDQ